MYNNCKEKYRNMFIESLCCNYLSIRISYLKITLINSINCKIEKVDCSLAFDETI